MTGNKIDNKGGMYFAAMLQVNNTLQKLDLGDTDLVSKIAILGHVYMHRNVSLFQTYHCEFGGTKYNLACRWRVYSVGAKCTCLTLDCVFCLLFPAHTESHSISNSFELQ